MLPQKYFKKFAAAVVQRSGISRPTVEAVLPHVFDEIRHILTEGNKCVPIEGFGTFAVIDRPEHDYLYNRNNANRICKVPAKRVIKFTPTKNLKREVDAGQFDPTRRAFTRHPEDPVIRNRRDMRYRPAKNYDRTKGSWGKPLPKDGPQDDGATDLQMTEEGKVNDTKLWEAFEEGGE